MKERGHYSQQIVRLGVPLGQKVAISSSHPCGRIIPIDTGVKSAERDTGCALLKENEGEKEGRQKDKWASAGGIDGRRRHFAAVEEQRRGEVE